MRDGILRRSIIGIACAAGLYSAVVFAQTVFSALQVNGQSDLRGSIVNGTGNVTVADTFDVDVAGGTDEMNITSGLVTIPGDLTVVGTCTGCGGGGGSPGGSDTQIQYNNGGAFGGIPEFTYNDGTTEFSIGSQATDWLLRGVAGATNDFGSGLDFAGGAGNGTGTGGGFYVVGGTGGATGDGGPLQLWAGSGGATSGNGGGIDIRGGNSQAGNSDGGSIDLTPGNGDGSGATGTINLNGDVTITGACTGCGGGQTTGTFTVNWVQACTTTPTQTWNYTLDGDIVTITPTQDVADCTSDSTSFISTAGDLPVAIRPNSAVVVPLTMGISATNNGTETGACLRIESDYSLALSISTAGFCSTANNWTSSGNKGMPGARGRFSSTYAIDRT